MTMTANGSTTASVSDVPRNTIRALSSPVLDTMARDDLAADLALVAEAAAARQALRAAASAAAEAAARALSLAALLDEALLTLATQDGATALALPRPSVASPATDGLSPREREVLALVAAGYTNRAIAEALYVSPNTVKTHVASLLSKLQVDSRVQLAALATTRGLHRQSAPESGS